MESLKASSAISYGIVKEEELKKKYQQKKEQIKDRLEEFRDVLSGNDKKLFSELAFCLMTPQSKATDCWNTVETLTNNDLLFSGSHKQMLKHMKNVRFSKTKSKRIEEIRDKLSETGTMKLKEKILNGKTNVQLREWLVENVKGFGYKESSHFLRNVGFGKDIAILDRHIMKHLINYGVIEEIPKNLNKKNYLEIENKFKDFAKKVEISMEELDLLFWSEETGFIFK